LKRPYYIFSSGKITRKENTIFFYPIPKETEEIKNELLPPQNDDEAIKLNTMEEEVLTETFSEEQKEEEKSKITNKKVIPIEDIESFYFFGEVNFNSRFLNFLTQNNIPAHIFNYYGFYAGSFYPREYLNSGFLVLNQVKAYLDIEQRLKIAKAFIEGASFNILKNLKYYNNRDVDLTAQIDTIESLRPSLDTVGSIQELMGVEGNIRGCYYSAFRSILNDKYDFHGRVKNPPDNIINTLMSFGNSLVYTTTLSEIYHTQLNPLISFLHEPGERRFSLSLDIAEIFKPIFTDRILFKLLNGNMLTEKHFEKKLNYCYLKEEGRKIFLKEFDEKMTTTIQHRSLKRSVSYRRLIRLECYKLVKHLAGDKPYEPFKIWW
jgi:CRISP-associated protein Cas1